MISMGNKSIPSLLCSWAEARVCNCLSLQESEEHAASVASGRQLLEVG